MAEFKVGDKVRYRGTIAEVVDPRLYGKRMLDGYVYIEYYDKNDKSYYGEGVKKTDLVAANSRLLNAKFKVGDKVFVKGYGMNNPVPILKVEEDKFLGRPVVWYTLKLSMGTKRVLEDLLMADNSRACNAKFKRGDVVRFKSPQIQRRYGFKTGTAIVSGVDTITGLVMCVDENGGNYAGVSKDDIIANYLARNAKLKVGDRVREKNGSLAPGNRMRVVSVLDYGSDYYGGGEASYVCVSESGAKKTLEESQLRLANSRACNSTNPVVAKAMNAVARNAGDNQGLWTEKEISYAKSKLGYFSPRITARGFMVGDSPTRGWFEIKKNGSGYNIQGDSYSLNPDDGVRFNRSESNFEKAVLFIFHTLKQR